MISALCARAWGSLVFLLCFASFSVGELSTSILVWFSGCNPHLVVALQVVVSAERCWECWTPALETSWLMVWDGHGEDYEILVLWRHAKKNPPSH